MKWPRHYANEIAALPDEQKKAAIAKCPKHFQAWIRVYLRNEHFKKKSAKSG